MPYKRRDSGPKAREHQITDAAVTLYERAKKLLRRVESEETRRELLDISRGLAIELKLKPWMTCPLDTLGFSGPSQWEGDSWWTAAAIADELEAALRARRKAARMAKSAA
jgi:hypothetical protein